MRSINCYTDTRLKGGGDVHQNFAVFVLSAELQYATDPLLQMPLQNKCRLFQLPSFLRKTNWIVELRKLQGYQIAKFIRCAEHKYIL